MTARTKLEELTNSWYGFALVTALVNLVAGGFGIFRMVWTALSLTFSLAITYAIGKALLRKSHIVRFLLLVASSLSMFFGSLGVLKLVLGSWSFGTLFTLGLSVASVFMSFRSFRTLRDSSVKAYCG
jgi:hypothetical protein